MCKENEILPCGCGGEAKLVFKKFNLSQSLTKEDPIEGTLIEMYEWGVECTKCGTRTKYIADKIVYDANGIHLKQDGRLEAIRAWNNAIGTHRVCRPTGKWMLLTEPDIETSTLTHICECSNCHFKLYTEKILYCEDMLYATKISPYLSKFMSHFCPNCGADMTGRIQQSE